eukprot:9503962-Pyramimonas_sp.AAC.1
MSYTTIKVVLAISYLYHLLFVEFTTFRLPLILVMVFQSDLTVVSVQLIVPVFVRPAGGTFASGSRSSPVRSMVVMWAGVSTMFVVLSARIRLLNLCRKVAQYLEFWVSCTCPLFVTSRTP